MKTRWIRWFLVAVVKPCVMCWIIVEGVPGVIRAIGTAGAAIVKAIGR